MSDTTSMVDAAPALSATLIVAIEAQMHAATTAAGRATAIRQMIEEMVAVVYWSADPGPPAEAEAELASLKELLTAAQDHCRRACPEPIRP